MTIRGNRIRANICAVVAAAIVILGARNGKAANMVKPDETKERDNWTKQHLLGPKPDLPFSFQYGGKASAELLPTWKKKAETTKLDNGRTQHTLTWDDPKSGLEVRCVVVEYSDFPTVEWTVHFVNTKDDDTQIVADVKAIDVTLKRGADGEFTLHRTVGDGGEDIYKPDPIAMTPNQEKQFAPNGGRPCSTEFPYFNVEQPDGTGMIFAIGWPGQWSAKFTRDGGKELRVKAGQELTHFKLVAREELRAPLIVAQFWKGDHAHSQNVWRQWMLAHNSPRPGGKPLPPQMNVCNCNQYGYFGITEDNQNLWIKRYKEEGVEYDYWWVDLCWFKLDEKSLIFNALYDPDAVRFPHGLKGLSDYLHQHKKKLIAWFEPEHYYPGPGNWIVENHPEWLLKAPAGHEQEINQGMPLKDRVVLNLGNREALKWLTDNTNRVIQEQGIDYYRHDFNVEPLIFWRHNDAPDRQGVTEIKYVTGFLAFYDELLRRNPGMPIDNCASGGRRNDVETLRRSVPLLRSDTWGEPVGQQCQTYGLANWIPFWGTGIVHSDPKDVAYVFRSQMGPSYTSCWDLTPKANYDLHRKLLEQWKSVRDYILNGDYYPLTPYSSAGDAWMAWQFDCPEKGEGLVQVFRRDKSEEVSKTLKLRGLDAAAQYAVTNLDTNAVTQVSGKDLVEKGLAVDIADKPGSAVITYKPAK
jgi:alpha-galactosidase